MSKHTPGPWFVDYKHNYDEIIGPKQEGIAQTGVWRVVEKEEQHANARLIAAAPDLIVALQDCIDALVIHAPDTWVLKQARAAITKAEG